MPSREEISYFGAGPAPLPTSVLQRASEVLLNYNDSGIGLTEISHRSPEATAILQSCKASLRNLYSIPDSDSPDGYQILFLQGGGTGEFSQTVYHFTSLWVARRYASIKKDIVASGTGGSDDEVEEQAIKRLKTMVQKELKMDYILTGKWSLKASQEAARLVGKDKVNVAVDARKFRDGEFGTIPDEKEWKLTDKEDDVAFTYLCDNETVDGVELNGFPKCLEGGRRNVVADMSSNFISRKVDVSKYAVIFGGAQKNVGIAGITIAIVKNSLLPPHAELASPDLLRRLGLPIGPIVLDWPTIAKNDSLYNTMPIFDIWIADQVMEELITRHGGKETAMSGQERESQQKADLIYKTLEKHPDLFFIVPDESARSRINVCFRVGKGDERNTKEEQFISGAKSRNLLGCKGHRSVGGCRVSNCKFLLCAIFRV